jgi:hypothetical protein
MGVGRVGPVGGVEAARGIEWQSGARGEGRGARGKG